jgi:hypothetical protein
MSASCFFWICVSPADVDVLIRCCAWLNASCRFDTWWTMLGMDASRFNMS